MAVVRRVIKKKVEEVKPCDKTVDVFTGNTLVDAKAALEVDSAPVAKEAISKAAMDHLEASNRLVGEVVSSQKFETVSLSVGADGRLAIGLVYNTKKGNAYSVSGTLISRDQLKRLMELSKAFFEGLDK